MSITFLFTSGKNKGSTLIMLGRNNLSEKFRRIPIVGGTGVFELARGIATTSTYSFDPVSHNAVLEYYLVVTHDDWRRGWIVSRVKMCKTTLIFRSKIRTSWNVRNFIGVWSCLDADTRVTLYKWIVNVCFAFWVFVCALN